MDSLLRRFWIGARVCTLIALVQATAVPASAQDQTQVLTLYSTRRDAMIVNVGDRELPRIIEQGLGASIDYYSEFIDQARLAQPGYHDAVRPFLRVKYGAQDFDVVIVIGDTALRFIADSREELFPKAPVVYFSTMPSAPQMRNATGVLAPTNLLGTLEMAAALHPEARHVFVIGGNTEGNAQFEAVARRQFEGVASRFDITFFSGLPANDLESRLASLPEHSIVYYLGVDRDASDKNYQSLEYLRRVVAVSNAPVYSWVDSTMGMGAVGGSLKSQTAEMAAVGDVALRVLNGEAADAIPPTSADLNVKQVDWRELQRWGISESRLPEGTLVRFRETSIWERYRIYILAAVVLVTAQFALIAGLLVQAARRRQAERGLVESQAKLRTSYNTISDLSGRLLLAQEAERAHLARELHDDVGQQIALLVTDLQQLGGFGRDGRRDPERALNVALDHAYSLSKSIHDLSHRLHPAKLRVLGLPAALEGLQREFSRPGFNIVVSYEDVPPALGHDVTLCVFRVIQEALQNAMKHSGAREVVVHLSGKDGQLTVTVVDDGAGFDVKSKFGSGLGLISMNERLEALGGTLTVRSAPNTGTRLKMQLPFAGTRVAKSIAI